MRQFTFYFTFFGKKMKYTIEAENKVDATVAFFKGINLITVKTPEVNSESIVDVMQSLVDEMKDLDAYENFKKCH